MIIYNAACIKQDNTLDSYPEEITLKLKFHIDPRI